MTSDALSTAFDGALATSFASYRIGRALKTAWPQLQLVEGNSDGFDFDGFTAAGHCERTAIAGTHQELLTRWNAPFLDSDGDASGWTAPFQATSTPKRGDGSVSRSTSNG